MEVTHSSDPVNSIASARKGEKFFAKHTEMIWNAILSKAIAQKRRDVSSDDRVQKAIAPFTEHLRTDRDVILQVHWVEAWPTCTNQLTGIASRVEVLCVCV